MFIEQHALSMQHRAAISDWITARNIKSVVDYGGGFGTLARLIARKNTECTINVYEPHPNEVFIQKTRNFHNIKIVKSLHICDCLVCTDVLEHVDNPLSLFSEMVNSVSKNGYLIIANNFTPIIKCHLPHTFHLRYTFNLFAKVMGLTKIGPLKGSHATIFKKENPFDYNLNTMKKYENLSIMFFTMFQKILPIFRAIKSILK